MEKIQIIVSGVTGSGKTSIAVAIGKLLEFYHGFNVEYHTDSRLEDVEEEEMQERLDTLAENVEIVINEVNLGREACHALNALVSE